MNLGFRKKNKSIFNFHIPYITLPSTPTAVPPLYDRAPAKLMAGKSAMTSKEGHSWHLWRVDVFSSATLQKQPDDFVHTFWSIFSPDDFVSSQKKPSIFFPFSMKKHNTYGG